MTWRERLNRAVARGFFYESELYLTLDMVRPAALVSGRWREIALVFSEAVEGNDFATVGKWADIVDCNAHVFGLEVAA